MRFFWITAPAALLAASAAYGQAQFMNKDGSRTQGAIIECATAGIAQPCGTTEFPLEVNQGAAAANVVAPSGGNGVLGFLSGIYMAVQNLYATLSATISVAGTVTALPASGPLIDNSTGSLGNTSTTLLLACGAGTAQQTGCTSGVGRSRLIVLNEGNVNACANFGAPAAFAEGSSSNCAAGSLLLAANGGGFDDSTGAVSNQQLNAACASTACVLTVKSY